MPYHGETLRMTKYVVVGNNIKIRPSDLKDVVVNNHFDGMIWTGRWKLTDKVKDDTFVVWLEDDTNPPEWMIYFGLVEKVMVPGGYVFEECQKHIIFTSITKMENEICEESRLKKHAKFLNMDFGITTFPNNFIGLNAV